MAAKPSIPKGTRDFSPDEILRREYIIETIKTVFKLYGYQPVETPAMENLSTLLGKYGEEGDRLIFRILNSGDFLSASSEEDLCKRDIAALSSQICEKGLRYDLTVPFARYVVQHRDQIIFPFKRYQIQTVWRADKPQKGRYREFLQCDVDVIGSNSLLNEVELIKVIDEIFSRLNIKTLIKVNSRKVLAGIADYAGASDRFNDITVALDKYEKLGWEKVIGELTDRGIGDRVIKEFSNILSIMDKDNTEKIRFLRSLLKDADTGRKGIEETEYLFSLLETLDLDSKVVFDLTLARGLNYYTGTIIEVKAADVTIGSICGGGRYDDLTGVFGLDGVSGVGVSFGADRIYDVMTQLNLFDNNASAATDFLVLNFGDREIKYALKILGTLRKLGIKSELYPDPAKLKKQLSFADARKIPYIIIAGEEEIRNNELIVKIMSSGKQEKILMKDLESFVMSGMKSLH